MSKKQSKENFMLAYGSRMLDVQNGGCAGLTKNGSYVWILGLPLGLLGKD